MKTVAFDVDGTLIDADDNPRQDIIERLMYHYKQGDRVVVWSGGGMDYARTWVSRLSIGNFVYRVLPKGKGYDIDLTYDDQIVTLGKENVCVGSGDHEEVW